MRTVWIRVQAQLPRLRASWLIVSLMLGLGLTACSSDSDDDFELPLGFTAADSFVDDDRAQCPGADHTSLQAAVDAAQPGQTISVCAGLYTGTVTVAASKTGLTLLGAGGDPANRTGGRAQETILDGSPAGMPGFDVQADNVTIIGFTVRNTDRSGIEIKPEDGVTPINDAMVAGNLLETIGDPAVDGTDCAGGRGMNFEVAADILVEDNVVTSSCGAGLRLRTVTGGIVQNNMINGSRRRPGIAVRSNSSNNMIMGNMSDNNREAGISLQSSTDNIVQDNEMSNNGVLGEPLRAIPGPGSNTDADDTTNLPLENPPQNTWQGNNCTTANRDGLC